MHRGFSIVIVALTAGVILLSGGIGYVELNTPNNDGGGVATTSQPTSTSDTNIPTSTEADVPNSWQTYRSEEMGVVFNHPGYISLHNEIKPNSEIIKREALFVGPDNFPSVSPLEVSLRSVSNAREWLKKQESKNECSSSFYPHCTSFERWISVDGLKSLQAKHCQAHQGCATKVFVPLEGNQRENDYILDFRFRKDIDYIKDSDNFRKDILDTVNISR